MRRTTIYFPLALAIVLAAGIYIGTKLNGGTVTGNDPYLKIRTVLNDIQTNYVDTVNAKQLTEKTITSMLQSLDPHSDYFSADQAKAMSEPLEGNFQGVGIEYNLLRDTVAILAVVAGGPSEKAGLHAGDRLVTVDGQSITGKKMQEGDIRKKLRGPGGSTVKVGVKRSGQPGLLEFEITRGTIPINSVDVAYMIDNETGYIRLIRFAKTSYTEFMAAAAKLQKLGMKKMILDLRDNGGGFLDIAVQLADEFLPAGKMIVYTKGRAAGREDHKSTAAGSYENMPVALLINEYSASASEIIAGALQDNDRGVVVGRRSFGKGLVQNEKQLPDGSAYRLTIARYYTPVGRCIQKPYNKGIDAYMDEEHDRFKHGELLNADSIHFPDSLKYKTAGGKTVYGGGGIMPDIFVPLDTAGDTKYFNALFSKTVFGDFAFSYADSHRNELLSQGREKFISSFTIDQTLFDNFLAAADKKGITRDPDQIKRSDAQIRRYLKASIARVIWNDEGFYPIINNGDTTVQKAIANIK